MTANSHYGHPHSLCCGGCGWQLCTFTPGLDVLGHGLTYKETVLCCCNERCSRVGVVYKRPEIPLELATPTGLAP